MPAVQMSLDVCEGLGIRPTVFDDGATRVTLRLVVPPELTRLVVAISEIHGGRVRAELDQNLRGRPERAVTDGR